MFERIKRVLGSEEKTLSDEELERLGELDDSESSNDSESPEMLGESLDSEGSEGRFARLRSHGESAFRRFRKTDDQEISPGIADKAQDYQMFDSVSEDASKAEPAQRLKRRLEEEGTPSEEETRLHLTQEAPADRSSEEERLEQRLVPKIAQQRVALSLKGAPPPPFGGFPGEPPRTNGDRPWAERIGVKGGKGGAAFGEALGRAAEKGTDVGATATERAGLGLGAGGAAVGDIAGRAGVRAGEKGAEWGPRVREGVKKPSSQAWERLKHEASPETLERRMRGGLSMEEEKAAQPPIRKWKRLFAQAHDMTLGEYKPPVVDKDGNILEKEVLPEDVVVLSKRDQRILEQAVKAGIPIIRTVEDTTKGRYELRPQRKADGSIDESLPKVKVWVGAGGVKKSTYMPIDAVRLSLQRKEDIKVQAREERFERAVKRFEPLRKGTEALFQMGVPARSAREGVGTVAKVAPRMPISVYSGFAGTRLSYAGLGGDRLRSATMMHTTPASQTRATSMLLPRQAPQAPRPPQEAPYTPLTQGPGSFGDRAMEQDVYPDDYPTEESMRVRRLPSQGIPQESQRGRYRVRPEARRYV